MRNIIIVVEKTVPITDGEFVLISELYAMNEKVKAVKFMKSQYLMGLKEAKDVCDAVWDATPPKF